MATGRVLCVDDEPLIRMLLADSVSDMGLAAIEADSGEEAIAMLDKSDVDLLITDIRMGEINGWQVAERARANQPGLPIIYISAYPTPGEPLAGTIYMTKPFRPHDLVAAVRKSLHLSS